MNKNVIKKPNSQFFQQKIWTGVIALDLFFNSSLTDVFYKYLTDKILQKNTEYLYGNIHEECVVYLSTIYFTYVDKLYCINFQQIIQSELVMGLINVKNSSDYSFGHIIKTFQTKLPIKGKSYMDDVFVINRRVFFINDTDRMSIQVLNKITVNIIKKCVKMFYSDDILDLILEKEMIILKKDEKLNNNGDISDNFDVSRSTSSIVIESHCVNDIADELPDFQTKYQMINRKAAGDDFDIKQKEDLNESIPHLVRVIKARTWIRKLKQNSREVMINKEAKPLSTIQTISEQIESSLSTKVSSVIKTQPRKPKKIENPPERIRKQRFIVKKYKSDVTDSNSINKNESKLKTIFQNDSNYLKAQLRMIPLKHTENEPISKPKALVKPKKPYINYLSNSKLFKLKRNNNNNKELNCVRKDILKLVDHLNENFQNYSKDIMFNDNEIGDIMNPKIKKTEKLINHSCYMREVKDRLMLTKSADTKLSTNEMSAHPSNLEKSKSLQTSYDMSPWSDMMSLCNSSLYMTLSNSTETQFQSIFNSSNNTEKFPTNELVDIHNITNEIHHLAKLQMRN